MEIDETHIRGVNAEIISQMDECLVIVHTRQFPLSSQEVKLIETSERDGCSGLPRSSGE